jgi:hypothetical protein
MTQILSGFGSDGSRVWDPTNKDQQEIFYEDLYATKTWERFARDFGNTPENRQSIEKVLDTLYADDEVTVLRFEDALTTGMDSGAISRKPVAPVAEPTPAPVDRNGRALSQSQIAFGEMTRWSQKATTAEVNDRKRRDPAYLRFVQSSLRKEMTEEGVGDSVMEQNPHLEQQAPPIQSALNNAEIVEFVKKYNSMSADECRAARSKAQNPFGFQRFIDKTEEAIRLRLL